MDIPFYQLNQPIPRVHALSLIMRQMGLLLRICMGGIFFSLGGMIHAQTDSSKVMIPDTSARGRMMMMDSSASVITPPPVQPKEKILKKIANSVKEELPRLEEEDEKLQLRLQFPWRDDIVIPMPKALKAAGNRPPFDPDVAYQRSLIIPGWGQAYNKSYWKIPLFYAGYGGFIWWINYNQQQYIRHGIAYRCALGLIPDCTLDPEFASFDAQGIRTRRDKFRRDRDYGVIIMLGWHGLHVIEAYVDAHLKGFDVSEDLTMKAVPTLVDPLQGYSPSGYSPGISFTLAF